MQTTESKQLAPNGRSVAQPNHTREVLAEEHRRFGRLLDFLEDQIALFHRGEQPDYELIQDVFFYMTNYPDRFHHPREELLFARIAERSPSVAAHVEVLHRQHHELAEVGARFLTKLEAILNDGLMTREEVEQPALEYIRLYREHLALEEREVFPAGAKLLQPEDWARVEAAVHLPEDPLFGALVDERYLPLHTELAARA